MPGVALVADPRRVGSEHSQRYRFWPVVDPAAEAAILARPLRLAPEASPEAKAAKTARYGPN